MKAFVKSGAILDHQRLIGWAGRDMTCQNYYEPSRVRTQRVRVVDADDPADVVDCLRQSREYYHRTVYLFVIYSLREMGDGGESEQDCEQNRSWGRRTQRPLS